jgi:hypothetical protein
MDPAVMKMGCRRRTVVKDTRIELADSVHKVRHCSMSLQWARPLCCIYIWHTDAAWGAGSLVPELSAAVAVGSSARLSSDMQLYSCCASHRRSVGRAPHTCD